MKQKNDHARIFFALLPDSKTLNAIEYHLAQFSPNIGKKVAPDNIHITLLFLGNVDMKNIEALCLDCDSISLPSFSLEISQAGWWQKPKILWLAPEKPVPPLNDLVSALNTAAARRQLPFSNRKYFPHITLMRKVTEAPQYPVIEPFTWTARDFCLMQSITRPEGVQYVELARWPLGEWLRE